MRSFFHCLTTKTHLLSARRTKAAECLHRSVETQGGSVGSCKREVLHIYIQSKRVQEPVCAPQWILNTAPFQAHRLTTFLTFMILLLGESV